jgi:hypothetical protein
MNQLQRREPPRASESLREPSSIRDDSASPSCRPAPSPTRRTHSESTSAPSLLTRVPLAGSESTPSPLRLSESNPIHRVTGTHWHSVRGTLSIVCPRTALTHSRLVQYSFPGPSRSESIRSTADSEPVPAAGQNLKPVTAGRRRPAAAAGADVSESPSRLPAIPPPGGPWAKLLSLSLLSPSLPGLFLSPSLVYLCLLSVRRV